MRRSGVRVVGAVVALLTACALGSTSGFAAADDPSGPQSLPELLDAFDIADQPIDFVVVVDVSRSMQEGADPLYPHVRQAYEEFVGAMRPDDHLSVVAFGADAAVTPLDPVGPAGERDDALDALPAEADGTATDIGAAIKAALERLERPDANEVQVVLFLTDGRHNPDATSSFQTTSGPAWDELQVRAQAVEEGHQLLVRGAGLSNGEPTDIRLLGSVFSDPETVNLSPDRIGPFFQETVDRSRVELLRVAVERELQEKARVTAPEQDELEDPMTVKVQIDSELSHLPVRVAVEDVTVTDGDGNVIDSRLTDGPQEYLIVPGAESPDIEVDLSGIEFDHDTRWFPETTQSRGLTVQLDTSAQLEPHDQLQRILGISDTEIRVKPLADPLDVSRTDGLTWAALFRFLMLLMLLALIAFLIWRYYFQTPPLVGALELPDRTVVPLKGTTMSFPGGKFTAADAGSARAEFFTRPRHRKKVYVRTKHPTVRKFEFGVKWTPLTGGERLEAGEKLRIGNLVVRLTKSKKARNASDLAAGPTSEQEGRWTT